MPPQRPRAPPALPDEVVEEVLLRVPPDDPASLARVALACRRWRRIVADPAFRHGRLALHGATPPMLGFVCDGMWDDGGARRRHQFARFVPTSSCVPRRADHRGRWAFDGHHGRVLLNGRSSSSSSSYMDFAVWDPISRTSWWRCRGFRDTSDA
jgi:hypothetical protein